MTSETNFVESRLCKRYERGTRASSIGSPSLYKSFKKAVKRKAICFLRSRSLNFSGAGVVGLRACPSK